MQLLNLKDLLSGKEIANASDYLYSIVDQKADKFLVSAYNEEVAKLDILMSLEATGEAGETDRIEYELFYGRDNPLGYPFLGLTTSELVLLRELVVNQVHFSSVLTIDGPHNAINDLLKSTRTTFQFKFALAFLNPFAGPASAWLCMENSGKNLQTILGLMMNGRGGGNFTRVELIQSIVANAVSYHNGKDDEKGGSVIRSLSDEIVTKEFLAAIVGIESMWKNYSPQLAVHARRLYDLDEAIPDEWVMSMFEGNQSKHTS